MRSPEPTLLQSRPLVEVSKPARQTSGPGPPRSQVIVEPSNERDSIEGSVLLSCPTLEQTWLPKEVNMPPTKIAPLGSTVTEYTSLPRELTAGLKVESRLPSEFRRPR